MIAPADMILFAAVVREGGFTRAAARLGLAKQTVSERIGRLEERLGVRLLERTTRRLRVTDAGARYYERCAAIAAQIDEANEEVRRLQAEPAGLLRVSAPVLYGRRYLAPLAADFLARYPKARVEISLSDRRVDLVAEGFDLAIRIGPPGGSSLTARRLGEGRVYYVASPALVDGRGALTARELGAARCVGTRRFETWEVGGAAVKVEPALVLNDLEAVCEAAILGAGIARLPDLVCWEAVRGGRLRVLFGGRPAVTAGVYAVFPSRRHLPPKVLRFVEALAAQVAAMPALMGHRRAT